MQGLVPEDQLLVFNVGEGWERLCAFLDKDAPDFEFPHDNTAGSDNAIHKQYNKFRINQKGNQEACLSLVKILASSISILLVGTWALKKLPF